MPLLKCPACGQLCANKSLLVAHYRTPDCDKRRMESARGVIDERTQERLAAVRTAWAAMKLPAQAAYGSYGWRPKNHSREPRLWVRFTLKDGAVCETLLPIDLMLYDPAWQQITIHTPAGMGHGAKLAQVTLRRDEVADAAVLGYIGPNQ